MLKNSETAWNRGDIAAFASDYEDAPTTTFVGREITRGGVDAILARYQRNYPTAEARGILTFSEIEVRPMGEDYALALGPLRPQAHCRRRRRRSRTIHARPAPHRQGLEDHSRSLQLGAGYAATRRLRY
jgi:hypothetical protein